MHRAPLGQQGSSRVIWGQSRCWSTWLPFSLAGPVDISVLHSIETIVIEWSHQVSDILSKDSAQPLLEGLHPLPRAEFEFWHTRMVNLQCINNQVPPCPWAAGSRVSPVLSPRC